MRKRNKLIVPSLLALGCFAADKAWAGVSFSYVTDQSSYSAAAGSDVTVNIYLQETLSGSPDYIAANGGLTGAGAGVNINSFTGTAASFGTSTNTFTSNAVFAGGQGYNAPVYNQGTGTTANNLEFVEDISTANYDNSSFSLTPTFSGSTGKILLGTLEVQVGTGTTKYVLSSLANDTINGSNSQLGQSDGNTFVKDPTPNGTDIDPLNSGGIAGADFAPNTTFTVSSSVSNKIISFTAAAPTTYGSQVATLTVHSFGTTGQYAPAYATLSPSTQTGYVEGLTFNPASDKEVYALDLTGPSNTVLTAGQLSTIEADINAAGDLDAAVASNVAGSPFASIFPGYNLLLTFSGSTFAPPSGSGANFLGFDFSAETNVPGVNVAEVALIPEPTSLGLLSIGALGMLGRRRKQNAAK